MKTAILIGCASAVVSQDILSRTSREAEPFDNDDRIRRYWQLKEMMNYFNPTFDQRKYWTYGCNCLMLGDRPMSDPGHGPPVDPLDHVCKQYKDCLKCAMEQHGDTCIGEFTRYKFSTNRFSNGRNMCNDSPTSCPRALCECDAMFAAAHNGVKQHYDQDYHMFYSRFPQGWDPEGNSDQCVSGGAGAAEPACCAAPGVPGVIMNALTHTCESGVVSLK